MIYFPQLKELNYQRIFVHNVGSLSRHIDDIVSDDDKIINDDIIGFTEIQVSPSYSTCRIIDT